MAGGLALSYIIDRSDFERRLSIQTDDLRKDVDLLAGRLEQSLNHQLQLTCGLAAFVRSDPYFDERDFDAFADALVDGQKGIRSLQLAPDAVVRFITNKKDNIKALGHDLFADPKRRPLVEKAIRERKYVIAGPIDLIQGGKAIIARLPVFLSEQSSGEEFWGFATILIDPIVLIGDAGIADGLPGVELA
ncbi:MAG: CHASE domain-containing protein [Alphaproteobacteria bacterium]|nr:CHASE domain-containing protein [Alphaproteobacteria bacterium]